MLSLANLGFRMPPRSLFIITLWAGTGLAVLGQGLPDGLPPAQAPTGVTFQTTEPSSLPDDPGQELEPVAQPAPAPAAPEPVEWEADHQAWAGNVATLTGHVEGHYRDYVIRADKVIYNRSTSEVEADGHLELLGGPNDVEIHASNGNMRLDTHTARFYNVYGSQGVRRSGRTIVYSTTNPLEFTGRVLLQTGEDSYRLVDGSITNCRLPHPDWRIISRSFALANGRASTSNSFFEFLGVPIFYLPYLHHPVAEGDRESGLLIPFLSNSSIKGYVVGEQVYWAISRSMDMVVGSEFYSKRGWAPNGDFRYRGFGLDHLTARWNALLDRGVEEQTSSGEQYVNQGGVDVIAYGRKDLSPETRIAGIVEYLSSYVYRLVFDDNYAEATSSEVSSDLGLIHEHQGLIPSVSLDRFQTFASTSNGDEAKILHLPSLRYDVMDRPLGSSPLEWGFGSSLSYLYRSEPEFHARNVGRMDLYPHLSLPVSAGGWSFDSEAGLRDTFYTISQYPDLTGANDGIPTISHDPLNRKDLEASLDVRPPALERDFELPVLNRELRHVIEPELNYRYVGGIGPEARNVLQFDTTDIVTDTDEAGFSLTQRFYLRPLTPKTCALEDAGSAGCSDQPREWASWQIAQEFFIDPNFGGAVISGRRNVFESTLDLTGTTFLTSPRNVSPLISRLRFDAIDNLRVQWDFDYDTKRGQMDSDNLFAGYSFGRTTIGIGHAMLNALEENPGSSSPTIKSQIVSPFIEFGKPTSKGFNFAANGSYDFQAGELQNGGIEAVYNWDCCGLSMGYRRFELGTVDGTGRNEHEWLYSFTLADFGSPGDIRRATSVFHDPTLPPPY
jgi:LPS-assembly protein